MPVVVQLFKQAKILSIYCKLSSPENKKKNDLNVNRLIYKRFSYLFKTSTILPVFVVLASFVAILNYAHDVIKLHTHSNNGYFD